MMYREVYLALATLVGLQAFFNAVYLAFPGSWGLNPVEFNMMVISADTSFLALFTGFKAWIIAKRADVTKYFSAFKVMPNGGGVPKVEVDALKLLNALAKNGIEVSFGKFKVRLK